MHLTSLISFASVIAGCLAAPKHGIGCGNDDLTIQTTSGRVHGIIDEANPHVRQFLGIPFAQPPIGSLRWLPPQSLPLSATKQDIDATQLPPSCMQYLTDLGDSLYVRDVLQFNLQGLNRTGSISEDCLTLSVWAPTSNSTYQQDKGKGSSLLPVEIFIYGGGFGTGGQDVPYQLPPQWVERTQDHLVVVFNYRLNIFGYPNAAGISEENQNVGLLDQRKAVEWVSANIARFGGDPSRMLLWGQSAGSISVDYYNYAYYDDPIVSAFSMDSGTAFSKIASDDTVHSNFSFVASQVGCSGYDSQPAQQLACMRSVNASTIESFVAEYQENGTLPAITFTPVVDERTVFSNYTTLALAGKQAKIPAIIGTNAQDGVAFAPYNPAGPNLTVAQYDLLYIFFCPVTETIRLRQATNLSTYRYLYSGNFSNISPRPWMGAYHSSELPMLMGTYANFRGPATELEMQTSVAMQDAWVDFTGEGTVGIQSTGWQEYAVLGSETVRNFGNGVAVKDTNLEALESLCNGAVPNYSI